MERDFKTIFLLRFLKRDYPPARSHKENIQTWFYVKMLHCVFVQNEQNKYLKLLLDCLNRRQWLLPSSPIYFFSQNFLVICNAWSEKRPKVVSQLFLNNKVSVILKLDGNYVFTAVSGIDHKVRASHPVWKFNKDSSSVILTG